ncbi:MAG: hypothetical protein ACRC6M_19730 [Microcystaceae cyanobacterium]
MPYWGTVDLVVDLARKQVRILPIRVEMPEAKTSRAEEKRAIA